MIDDLENAIPLVEVARADVVSLLIDGERLSDIDKRHQLRSEVTQILSAIVESGLTTKRQRLALILTKFDRIQFASDQTRVSRDLQSLLDRLQCFAEHFRAFGIFKTAASPKDCEIARGFGIPELVAYWTERNMSSIEKAATAEIAISPSVAVQGDRPRRMFWRLAPLKDLQAQGR